MYRSDAPPPTFVVPEGTPVLAARAGKLWSVQQTARGLSVVVDHGKPFATFYQHLASVDPAIAGGGNPSLAFRGMAIEAGQRLGTVGIDPTDPSKVRHLHFAVWYNGSGDGSSVDPSSVMPGWRRIVWTP